jgi:nitroreductase
MCEHGEEVYELIIERRTIRQFRPDPVPAETLERVVNAGRLAPSAANLQPLEFIVVDAPEVRKKVFPCLKWAAYIAPEGDPKPGHEPAAYVVVLVNTRVREELFEYDVGAAVENMILAALAEEVGSCWLLSVDRDRLREALQVPAHYRIDCVLALGYPDEAPVVETMAESPCYWKDAEGRLHVPKRALKTVMHRNVYGETKG